MGANVVVLGMSGGRTAVVCYRNSPSLLRAAPKDYDLGKLCAHCCTHLFYTGARVDPNGLRLQFQEDDTGLKSVRDMDALKTSHPQLRLVLSVQHVGSGPLNLTEGTDAASRRALLADSMAHWLGEFNFEGVELDWDRLPVDLNPVYVGLVRAMRIDTKKILLLTLVSIHMKGGPSHNVEARHSMSCLLIVHAYSKEDTLKTAVPPIIFKEDLLAALIQRSMHDAQVEACETFLGELRFRQRVVLALFGYAYRLRNSGRYELRASVRGPAPPGPFTKERGLLVYFEVLMSCLLYAATNASRRHGH
ncbi:chitotriosidase-1-like [Amblyomma americanum]